MDVATPLPVHSAETVPSARSHVASAPALLPLHAPSAEAATALHAVISAEATVLLPVPSAVAEASRAAMAVETVRHAATAIQMEAAISVDEDKNDILLFFAHNSLQI